MRTQSRSDRLFRLCADDLIHELSVFEDEQRRDAADVELSSRPWILVYIQFRNRVTPV